MLPQKDKIKNAQNYNFISDSATHTKITKSTPFYHNPKFYFILGIIFNLCLLGFFKYTDFLLENFNAFSKLARLDFDIPLPHILLPLALSFVTFQQIAFLFDCYKRAKGELSENLNIDFVDYALFISFFPQLVAGPIVHHREMMPQFIALGSANSSLGTPCGDFGNLGRFADSKVQSHAPNSQKTPQLPPQILEFRDLDSANQAKNAESRLDSATRTQSTINYEFLAKGIFIFSIGLFKKVFIADSFAKWANVGFSVVESGGVLNIAESWATSLSYTFQLYFDFSGYCDMAMGLALMFGIVLPLNFDSPYKSLNIAEFWRRWHITLGRFLRECLYIPLGGNRGKGNSSLTQSSREFEKSSLDGLKSYLCSDFSAQPTNLAQDTRIANDLKKQSHITKILTLRNLFIVAFLSGIWHGAGFGFIIWGVLHGMAMITHRIYSWRLKSMRFVSFTKTRLYKFLCWFITFNFINIAWVFFRAENLNGAVNLIKGMFGVANVETPHKWSKIFSALQVGSNEIVIWVVCAFIVCLAFKNAFEMLQDFNVPYFRFCALLDIFGKRILIKGGAVWTRFVLTIALFYIAIWAMLSNLLDSNTYTPFLYFNF